MNIFRRNNVTLQGNGEPGIMFAHGFGCDHNMWRFVAPQFTEYHRVVLFDHVGAGGSDIKAYEFDKYASLDGYAEDIVEIASETGLKDAVFVGHSVAAMMGIIAASMAPGIFAKLVLVGPSPYYIDEGDYIGGFTRAQINELLEFLDVNYLGWSRAMAPLIMGNPDREELAEELGNSFCRTDPEIAKAFARTTFLSDAREVLDGCTVKTLILQCSEDVIAPEPVGRYVHSRMPNSEIIFMRATGHCPNLSAPDETVAAIKTFLASDTV